MTVIVRCLWGEAGVKHGRWERVWRTVRSQIRLDGTEQFVYVYGKTNADLLSEYASSNYRVVLMDDRPYPEWVDKVEGRSIIRPWHYKHQLIRKALSDHGRVVYCDWDVVCRVDSIHQIEDELGDGNRLSLYAYHMKRWGNYRYNGLWTPSGNWLYVTDASWIDSVLDYMRKDPKCWHDEWAMCRLLKWRGESSWLRRYESPVMIQKEKRCPWKLKRLDGLNITRETPIPFRWKRLFFQGYEWL